LVRGSGMGPNSLSRVSMTLKLRADSSGSSSMLQTWMKTP
jgi:hypothetical protein